MITIKFRDDDAEAEFWDNLKHLCRRQAGQHVGWNAARVELARIVNQATGDEFDGVEFVGTHDERDDDEDEDDA